MIDVVGLSKRFSGQTEPALNNVSFSVNEGDFIVISGANGSGKSVLMNLIASLDEPNEGVIKIKHVNGKPVRVGLVFQDSDAQILGDTCEEDVAFGPRNLGMDKSTSAQITKKTLERVGLIDKLKAPARSLSGGEKRRLAVAGVLAMDAGIIIFDEPFANLDWPGVVQVNSILTQLKNDGKTIIILTHELEKVLGLANRLLILFHGSLVFDGSPINALNTDVLKQWGIRNPLRSYTDFSDLIWTDS